MCMRTARSAHHHRHRHYHHHRRRRHHHRYGSSALIRLVRSCRAHLGPRDAIWTRSVRSHMKCIASNGGAALSLVASTATVRWTSSGSDSLDWQEMQSLVVARRDRHVVRCYHRHRIHAFAVEHAENCPLLLLKTALVACSYNVHRLALWLELSRWPRDTAGGLPDPGLLSSRRGWCCETRRLL